MSPWWIWAIAALAGLAGGGGIVALLRRDWKSQGAAEHEIETAKAKDRDKDETIAIIKGQRDGSVPDAAGARRVWDALRDRFR